MYRCRNKSRNIPSSAVTMSTNNDSIFFHRSPWLESRLVQFHRVTHLEKDSIFNIHISRYITLTYIYQAFYDNYISIESPQCKRATMRAKFWVLSLNTFESVLFLLSHRALPVEKMRCNIDVVNVWHVFNNILPRDPNRGRSYVWAVGYS